MAHTAVISIAALRRLFLQWVISRFGDEPWPPRSPDLTAPDLFLLNEPSFKALDDQGSDGETNFILRIKDQETHLTLHEHDDDDDDHHHHHLWMSLVTGLFFPVLLLNQR